MYSFGGAFSSSIGQAGHASQTGHDSQTGHVSQAGHVSQTGHVSHTGHDSHTGHTGHVVWRVEVWLSLLVSTEAGLLGPTW